MLENTRVFSLHSLCFLCEMECENDGDHSTIPSGGKGQVTRQQGAGSDESINHVPSTVFGTV